MYEGRCYGCVVHSPRTVGISVASHVGSGEQRLPHVCRERISGPCQRYHSAQSPPIVTARPALAACNVSSYSEA